MNNDRKETFELRQTISKANEEIDRLQAELNDVKVDANGVEENLKRLENDKNNALKGVCIDIIFCFFIFFLFFFL